MATYYVTTSGDNGNAGTSEGAAWADPGYAATQLSAGDILYIKSGTYTITTATPGAAGPFSLSTIKAWIEGYETTPGDRGAMPVLDAGAITGVTLWNATGSNSSHPIALVNLKADGQDGTGNIGFQVHNTRQECISCEAVDCPDSGFHHSGSSLGGPCVDCRAAGCGTGFTSCRTRKCEAFDCTVGFGDDAGKDDAIGISCLAHDCGTGFSSDRGTWSTCTAYNCTGDGFSLTLSSLATNCLAVGNGAYGFDSDATGITDNCYTYNNVSSPSNNLFVADVTELSGDPFENAGSDDFRPNNTAGAGAVIRGAGYGVPGQTDNVDASAVQHTDPAGGGGGSRAVIIGG